MQPKQAVPQINSHSADPQHAEPPPAPAHTKLPALWLEQAQGPKDQESYLGVPGQEVAIEETATEELVQ